MKEKRNLLTGIGLISAFALWTVLIQCVDVQAVGQNGTKIGHAAFNVWFHQLTGVHMTIYTITDWLGLVPIFVCLCSGMLGIVQLIKRRSLLRVDSDILLLGAYYVIVIACYLVFEMIPINYRPILIGKTGSILSVINDTIGTRRDANLDISGVQKSGESSDQKSDGGICNLFFGIYGNRQADIRGALGDGYSCVSRIRLFLIWSCDIIPTGMRWQIRILTVFRMPRRPT